MLNDRKNIIPDTHIKTIFEGKAGRARKMGQEFLLALPIASCFNQTKGWEGLFLTYSE